MNRIGDNLICTGSNEAIVRAFERFGVDFLVVGGLAIAWYCPSRQADDMDLLVNPTPDNSVKVSIALGSLGLSGFGPESFSRPGVQAQLKPRHYADIITPARDGISFEDVADDCVAGKLFGTPVRIPSAASLIRLKEGAAAATEKELLKHRQDIALLREHAV